MIEASRVRQQRRRWCNRGNSREVRPDFVVEDVAGEGVESLRRAMHHQRLGPRRDRCIDQHRQESSVIDVGEAKKDVGNPREFGRRLIANARAAIDYHVVIDEKRRGAKLTADRAVATQTSTSHAASP